MFGKVDLRSLLLFIFIFFNIFIGVYLLHNTMLVSVAQQSESALCIHMSPYPLPLEPPSHPPYPTPLGHCKAPSQSPWLCCCSPPVNYFTFGSVCMSLLISLCPSFPLPTPCPQVHSLCLHLYSCLPLGSSVYIYNFRFHIYVLAYSICFSLSDLLHSV